MVSLILASNFIWNIEIQGINKISKDEIETILENDGVSIGKNKHRINKQEIINTIRLQRDDTAWMGIEIKGTKAIIKIVEAEKNLKF